MSFLYRANFYLIDNKAHTANDASFGLMMWLHDDVIHDMLYLASIYWKRLIFTDCHEIVMDRPMNRPSYRDVRMPLKTCSGLFMIFPRFHLLKNIDFPCFLRKRDRRTDGRTDGRTDRPGYRDARTHLKILQVTSGNSHSCTKSLDPPQ